MDSACFGHGSGPLPAAEHIVRAFGDFPDRPFIEDSGPEDVLPHIQVVVAEDVDHGRDADRVADHRNGPQRKLRDDVLPHLLVRDAGQGCLDVGGLFERHHETIRELAPDLVRDARGSLVDEGQDEIELPRLTGEPAERVRVRRDLGAQELVGLLEEQDEARVFLVPLRVQLEQAAREDVRDEQVDHLIGPVIPEVEDDALPVAVKTPYSLCMSKMRTDPTSFERIPAQTSLFRIDLPVPVRPKIANGFSTSFFMSSCTWNGSTPVMVPNVADVSVTSYMRSTSSRVACRHAEKYGGIVCGSLSFFVSRSTSWIIRSFALL